MNEWYWGKPENDEEEVLVKRAQDLALFNLITQGVPNG